MSCTHLRNICAIERAYLIDGLAMYIDVAQDQTLEFLSALMAAVQNNDDCKNSASLMERATCSVIAESDDEHNRLEWILLHSSDVRLAIATVFTANEVKGLIRVLLDHPRTRQIFNSKSALHKLGSTWGEDLVRDAVEKQS